MFWAAAKVNVAADEKALLDANFFQCLCIEYSASNQEAKVRTACRMKHFNLACLLSGSGYTSYYSTGCGLEVGGSDLGGGEIFLTRPDQPWRQCSLW